MKSEFVCTSVHGSTVPASLLPRLRIACLQRHSHGQCLVTEIPRSEDPCICGLAGANLHDIPCLILLGDIYTKVKEGVARQYTKFQGLLLCGLTGVVRPKLPKVKYIVQWASWVGSYVFSTAPTLLKLCIHINENIENSNIAS